MRFSLTTASGDSFCNRDKERKQMRKLLQDNQHIWIQAPRRYGKTSLVEQVVSEVKRNNPEYALISIDFWTAVDASSCIKKIADGISDYLNVHDSSKQNFFNRVAEHFSNLEFSIKDSKVHFGVKRSEEPGYDDLMRLIKSFDGWLEEERRTAALHFDEFQVVGQMDKTFAFEAAIRSSVQQSKNISFIFSGSNRNLMDQAMSSKDRPLYRHCVPIRINRISEKHYKDHINLAANEVWGDDLTSGVMDLIFLTAKCHASYTASLCLQLMGLESPPTESDVIDAWRFVVEGVADGLRNEVAELGLNERKVLLCIAKSDGPVKHPASDAFSKQANVKVGSLGKTIRDLSAKDHIEKIEDGWRVVDPALEYLIRMD